MNRCIYRMEQRPGDTNAANHRRRVDTTSEHRPGSPACAITIHPEPGILTRAATGLVATSRLIIAAGLRLRPIRCRAGARAKGGRKILSVTARWRKLFVTAASGARGQETGAAPTEGLDRHVMTANHNHHRREPMDLQRDPKRLSVSEPCQLLRSPSIDRRRIPLTCTATDERDYAQIRQRHLFPAITRCQAEFIWSGTAAPLPEPDAIPRRNSPSRSERRPLRGNDPEPYANSRAHRISWRRSGDGCFSARLPRWARSLEANRHHPSPYRGRGGVVSAMFPGFPLRHSGHQTLLAKERDSSAATGTKTLYGRTLVAAGSPVQRTRHGHVDLVHARTVSSLPDALPAPARHRQSHLRTAGGRTGCSGAATENA